MRIYRVRTLFTGVTGSPWYSNLYFNGTDTRQAADASAAVNTFWGAAKTVMSSQVIIDVDDNVAVMESTTGKITGYIQSTRAPFPGTGGSNLAPTATQALITLRTGVYRYGRPVIGKLFVPGLFSGALTSEGQIGSGAVTALNNAAAGLNNATAGGALLGWGVLSLPRQDKFGFNRPGDFNPVFATATRQLPGVLRSRRD